MKKYFILVITLCIFVSACEAPVNSSEQRPQSLEEISFDATAADYAYPDNLVDGDLLIGFTDQFTMVWTDAGSGNDDDLAIHEPDLADGYKMLGHIYLTSNGTDPDGNTWVPIVKEISGSGAVLAPPVDFTAFHTTKSYNNGNLTFWVPVPPEGYIALGLFTKRGTEKPDIDTCNLVCVKEEYTVQAKAGNNYWTEVLFSGLFPQSAYCVKPHSIPEEAAPENYMFIETNCFSGLLQIISTSEITETTSILSVLKIRIPVVADHDYSDIFPQLTGYSKPEDNTPSNLAKIVSVPFYTVTDNEHDLHWKITNSPIYRIRRDTYFKLLLHSYNQSSVLQTESHTYSTGITSTETQTAWESSGIEINASAGIKLLKIGAKINKEVGFASQSSLSTFENTTVTKNLDIPSGTSAALWQRMNRFTVLRQAEDESWEELIIPIPWAIPDNSFVLDDF